MIYIPPMEANQLITVVMIFVVSCIIVFWPDKEVSGEEEEWLRRFEDSNRLGHDGDAHLATVLLKKLAIPPDAFIKTKKHNYTKFIFNRFRKLFKSSSQAHISASLSSGNLVQHNDGVLHIPSLNGVFHLQHIPLGSTPLIAFVNSRSGGQRGAEVMRLLKAHLNPACQVVDVTKTPPEPIIRALLLPHHHQQSHMDCHMPGLVFLVCGGDGTVGWILNCIARCAEYNRNQRAVAASAAAGPGVNASTAPVLGVAPPPPPVAVLPLGTGNDLSYVLGWGSSIGGLDTGTGAGVAAAEAAAVGIDSSKSGASASATAPVRNGSSADFNTSAGTVVSDLLASTTATVSTSLDKIIQGASGTQQQNFPDIPTLLLNIAQCGDIVDYYNEYYRLLQLQEATGVVGGGRGGDKHKGPRARAATEGGNRRSLERPPSHNMDSSMGLSMHSAHSGRSRSPWSSQIGGYHSHTSTGASSYDSGSASGGDGDRGLDEFEDNADHDDEDHRLIPGMRDGYTKVARLDRWLVRIEETSGALPKTGSAGVDSTSPTSSTNSSPATAELPAIITSPRQEKSSIMESGGSRSSRGNSNARKPTPKSPAAAAAACASFSSNTSSPSSTASPSKSKKKSSSTSSALSSFARQNHGSIVFNNYFSMGVDAQIVYNFHTMRGRRPDAFFAQWVNKLWYGVMGGQEVLDRSCADLPAMVKLFINDREVELPEGTEGVIFCNIGSYAGGTHLWRLNDAEDEGEGGKVGGEEEEEDEDEEQNDSSEAVGSRFVASAAALLLSEAGSTASSPSPESVAARKSSSVGGKATSVDAHSLTEGALKGAIAQKPRSRTSSSDAKGAKSRSRTSSAHSTSGSGGIQSPPPPFPVMSLSQSQCPDVPSPLVHPFRPDAMDDGVLEIMAVTGSLHLAQIKVGVASPIKVAQVDFNSNSNSNSTAARHKSSSVVKTDESSPPTAGGGEGEGVTTIRIVSAGGRALPLQVDGEPWLETAPCELTLSLLPDKATVLVYRDRDRDREEGKGEEYGYSDSDMEDSELEGDSDDDDDDLGDDARPRSSLGSRSSKGSAASSNFFFFDDVEDGSSCSEEEEE